jgi:hypothetical protein
MSAPQPSHCRSKAAVSVTTMARTVGLSRSRFYDYIKRGVFPWPLYSLATKRPFFAADMQSEILAVRQTGIGTNGEYVLFYERREGIAEAKPQPIRRRSTENHLEALRSLGLSIISQAQVEGAMAKLFPGGISGIEEAAVIRTLYRHLRHPGG